MANRFVWSGASGAGTGADFTNAHTTMAAAITASAAGDTFKVADDHNETIGTSATTLTFKGTAAAPDRIISVNRGTGLASQGALIKTTGASNITLQGHFRWDGVNITVGDSTNAAQLSTCGSTGNVQRFTNCTVTLTNNNSSRVNPNSASSLAVYGKGFGIVGGSTGSAVAATSDVQFFNNTPWSGAALPTNFATTGGTGSYLFDGCDLSPLAGKSLRQTAANSRFRGTLVNCKLSSTMNIFSGAILSRNEQVDIINCSNADGVTRNERHRYEGVTSIERTIVRTGGANDGIDNYSQKIVTSAGASRDFPMDSIPASVFIAADDVGVPITLTLHVVTDNVTLTDIDAWLDVEYLNDSGTLITTQITDGPANALSTGTNQAADSGTAWTTTGLSTPVKQKLEVTMTPARVGSLRVKTRIAKASATVYVCPKVDIS